MSMSGMVLDRLKLNIMSKFRFNEITHGLSGKFGALTVFKQVNGKTILARPPKKTEILPTANQLAVQEKFKMATVYAKNILVDPIIKNAYASKAKIGQTAFNVAFADFFNAPSLSLPQLNDYTGQIGDAILVRALDDFKVEQVTVSIFATDGTLIESGEAQLATNGLDWQYNTTALNAALTGSKVVFQATDLPGNTTTLEVNL
jgi:hypothetical protein